MLRRELDAWLATREDELRTLRIENARLKNIKLWEKPLAKVASRE